MREKSPLWILILNLGLSVVSLAHAETSKEIDEGKDPAWTPVAPHERVVASAWGEETALLRKAHLLTFQGAEAHPGFTSSLLVGRDGNKIPVQTVRVVRGRVDAVLIPSTVERGVLLAAPDSISAIANRGRVSLSVTDKKVYVQALRGEALVGHRGLFKKLPPGIIRVFDRLGGRSEDLAPSPPPTLLATSGLGVALTGGAEMGALAKGDGQVCIGLQDANNQAVGPSECAPAGTEVKLFLPSAGTYYAVARRLGLGELEGQLSDPVPLRLLGLAEGQTLPKGGVFLLDQFERVKLRGTEGLEMRVGSSKVFVPATDSLGLAQGKPTVIEFRVPKAPDQRTQLRLAPKIGDITTSIGPPGLVWPGKPAQIKVSVRDGSGKLLDEKDGVRLAVSVNSQEIPMKFQRTETGLRAEVPAQSGAGPWVVRLQIYDEKSNVLARDFLEVVPRQ